MGVMPWQRPSLAATAGDHERRERALERDGPGANIYVLPIAPAAVPADFYADDPLAPPFENGAANLNGSQPVGFRAYRDRRIKLFGAVDPNTVAAPMIIYHLPELHRPPNAYPFISSSLDGTQLVFGRVDTDGAVWILAVVGV